MAYNYAVEGGYDYDFVESPPDRLVCKICHFPCREAQVTECCGYMFCKCCLIKFRSSTSISQACPTCRQESFTTFPHRGDDREIKALRVNCPNVKGGCGWTGELVSIVGHKPFQKCERCDKCDDIIHYSDIHLPTNCPCYCPHCETTADREVISSKHKEKCHRFPLRCPNNCGRNDIPREDMDDHKKMCPLEMIQCEYQCGARIARKEVKNHNQEKITEHIQLSCEKATKILSILGIELHDEQSAEKAKTKQVNRGSPIRSHLTTVVMCIIIIILALLLQSYYTTTDDNLDNNQNGITELLTTEIM